MIGAWTALPAGFVIATLATLVGIGGGILWMPYLIFLAHLSPAQAIVTSLIIQVGGMGSGSIAVIRAKKTDLRFSLFLAVCAFPGVPVGVWISRFVPADSIVFILGVACLIIGLVFVYTQEEPDNEMQGDEDCHEFQRIAVDGGEAEIGKETSEVSQSHELYG